MRQFGSVVFLSLVLALGVAPSCSTQTTTVTKETIERPVSSNGKTEVVERETTVTKESEGSSGGGILSTTVNIIGEILALPFRIVGGLIRIIF